MLDEKRMNRLIRIPQRPVDDAISRWSRMASLWSAAFTKGVEAWEWSLPTMFRLSMPSTI